MGPLVIPSPNTQQLVWPVTLHCSLSVCVGFFLSVMSQFVSVLLPSLLPSCLFVCSDYRHPLVGTDGSGWDGPVSLSSGVSAPAVSPSRSTAVLIGQDSGQVCRTPRAALIRRYPYPLCHHATMAATVRLNGLPWQPDGCRSFCCELQPREKPPKHSCLSFLCSDHSSVRVFFISVKNSSNGWKW